MLTKSLHTITAATNVARHLLACYTQPVVASKLAADSLSVLGYPTSAETVRDACGKDPTITRIFEACEKLIAQAAINAHRLAREYENRTALLQRQAG